MRQDPRPEPTRLQAAAALMLAGGLVAADAPARKATAPLSSSPKAYVLLSAPAQEREILRGQIRGRNPARYLVTTDPGEALDIRLNAAHPGVYYTLTTPGGGVLLYDSSDPESAQRHMRRLAPGGRYRLEVRLADAAARHNVAANYSLSVTREAKVVRTR